MPMNTRTIESNRPSSDESNEPSVESNQRAISSVTGLTAAGKPWLNAHLVIWLVAMALALVTASECQSGIRSWALLYGLALWGWWGCVASVAWSIGKRAPIIWTLTPKVVMVHVLAGLGLGFAHLVLLRDLGLAWTASEPNVYSREMWNSLLNRNRLGLEFLIYGFILGIGGIIQFQIRAQREATRALELEKQLSAAHLRALQMQLEPHFLFNTLNAITTLVELGRQKAAAEMLGHLNLILKRTLSSSAPEKIPLSQELEFVTNYLAIEQVRFADRLRIEIDVDPRAIDGLVPCFLLQPIVENAIRHGIANCENEGVVQTSAVRDGDELQVRVRDSGSGRASPKEHGHGIGLRNTRERLEHFYQGGYKMRAYPLAAGGFEVAITIPYERCEV
jgi:sensor histidine kinase YesM